MLQDYVFFGVLAALLTLLALFLLSKRLAEKGVGVSTLLGDTSLALLAALLSPLALFMFSICGLFIYSASTCDDGWFCPETTVERIVMSVFALFPMGLFGFSAGIIAALVWSALSRRIRASPGGDLD